MKKKDRKSYVSIKNLSDDISMDVDGISRFDSLVLVDKKDGKEWEISISDGKIVIEPFDLSDKRDYKIKKVIDGDK